MSCAARGLLLLVEPNGPPAYRIYIVSEPGKAFMRAQVEQASARAAELAAQTSAMPPRSAEEPPQDAGPNPVGAWDR